jgi:hypothetical protein
MADSDIIVSFHLVIPFIPMVGNTCKANSIILWRKSFDGNRNGVTCSICKIERAFSYCGKWQVIVVCLTAIKPFQWRHLFYMIFQKTNICLPLNRIAHFYVIQNKLVEGSSEKVPRTKILKNKNVLILQIVYYFNLSSVL